MKDISKCPRQYQIAEYLFLTGNTGKTESEIQWAIYKVDRSTGVSNKAGADALRRALKNGFIKRREVKGKKHKFEYFINTEGLR